jgi:FlaA1/EpsC-like NDP-sugar epimerase
MDAVLTVLAYYGAFLARFDGTIPPEHRRIMIDTLPVLLAVHIVTAYGFSLYDIVWRYVSMWDITRIAVASSIGSIALFLTSGLILWIHIPYTIYPLTFLLLVTLRGGMRACRRAMYELKTIEQGKRILIYGAGDAGVMIVRDMKYNSYYGYTPVGFVVTTRPKSAGASTASRCSVRVTTCRP